MTDKLPHMAHAMRTYNPDEWLLQASGHACRVSELSEAEAKAALCYYIDIIEHLRTLHDVAVDVTVAAADMTPIPEADEEDEDSEDE